MRAPDASSRILIAGVGNVLRGDDGLGIRVLRALEPTLGGRPGVHLYESGIAGIGLVQELMAGYDALVLVDALERGAPPGHVFVLEPRIDAGRTDERVDLHQADPEAVFRMAAALGVLPKRAWIVGCQARECDELTMELSPPVARAVSEVVSAVLEIVQSLQNLPSKSGTGSVAELAAADEILQILFWLRGEGLAEDASPGELARWLSLNETEIAEVLGRLVRLGLVDRVSAERFRLTSEGHREGGRRFQDEFSDMLKPGHGECGDPDCECQESGDPADCRHLAR